MSTTTKTKQFTHTCPKCGAQEITFMASAVVSHDCPKDTRSRSRRTMTTFVKESPKVPASWADELSEADDALLFAMLAEDNLAMTGGL